MSCALRSVRNSRKPLPPPAVTVIFLAPAGAAAALGFAAGAGAEGPAPPSAGRRGVGEVGEQRYGGCTPRFCSNGTSQWQGHQ